MPRLEPVGSRNGQRFEPDNDQGFLSVKKEGTVSWARQNGSEMMDWPPTLLSHKQSVVYALGLSPPSFNERDQKEGGL
jgi:hypothetical protein